ncbi:GPI mannosyltransferase 1 [Achroia grisella]|uniref:GPI mannosyltransferase 1 n=1 Tax=Achroia grisella TaxID=688607 RepID=UPI0027D2A713|nr:GPI mannosyltransferase 1 [Achroia grisella]
MDAIKQYLNLPFRYHLLAGAIIRLILIIYGDFHDKTYDVPYTDVDYKVFSDAARHVIDGNSPYQRHTYRYSPLLAFLMIPNILIARNFGKALFSVFDLLVAIAIKILVEHQFQTKDKEKLSKIAVYCTLFWLYNPLSIGISTRGNADSVPCFFIIVSILFLQTNVVRGLLKYALSGILLGISIHLRLYPLAFSFPMYLSLGTYKITRNTSIKEGFIALMPNKKQIILALSCITTLFVLTYSMYILYGYEFLFETYIYHLFRKDTRHNFSLLFYYSYLTMDHLSFDIVKTISQAFECIILFIISLTFGCEPKTLSFALFSQAVVLVAFNSVMTSQYFVWFLSLLPLVVHNMKIIPAKALILTVIWICAQGAWLFYAYLLEFKCRQVFIFIWLKSIVFFCSNIFVLGQLIKSYTSGHGFGHFDVPTKIKSK